MNNAPLPPLGHLVVKLIEEPKEDTGKMVTTNLIKPHIRAKVIHIGNPLKNDDTKQPYLPNNIVYLDKDAPFEAIDGYNILRFSAVKAYKQL